MFFWCFYMSCLSLDRKKKLFREFNFCLIPCIDCISVIGVFGTKIRSNYDFGMFFWCFYMSCLSVDRKTNLLRDFNFCLIPCDDCISVIGVFGTKIRSNYDFGMFFWCFYMSCLTLDRKKNLFRDFNFFAYACASSTGGSSVIGVFGTKIRSNYD